MIHHREKIGIELVVKAKPKGVIKRINLDFIVCEMTRAFGTLPLLGTTRLDGVSRNCAFVLFNLTKQGITSHDAVCEVARQLRVSSEIISMHGMKDRWATTAQLIAVQADVFSRDLAFSHSHINLGYLGTACQPLYRGGNAGNFFRIRIRQCYEWPDFSAARTVPNFFGSQRFGKTGDEQDIGKLLLIGKAEDAWYKISYLPLRKLLEQALKQSDGDYRQAFLHPMMRETTMFAIQQWQSYLFNKLLSQHIRCSLSLPEAFPLWCRKYSSLYQSV